MPFYIMNKKTVVLGASTNPDRYAWKAVVSLQKHGFEVVPVGNRAGEIGGLPILLGQPKIDDVDTITLYLGEARQPEFYDWIFSLSPRRLIFNPGAENRELFQLARERGIEVEEACTLVMLSIGVF